LTHWRRNPIDVFVLARLEQHGLSPSLEADPATLARRVSFDLVGLQPLPEEIDAFLDQVRQTSLDSAYDRLLDRLLASPQYGERWARPWLDLASYADTNGYEKDRTREIWPYRDWVIRALNEDLPFDQYTIEQVAGDLLPGATIEQRTATGFFRNTMLNEEGGIDPLEYRFYAMRDRVGMTGTAWLGITLHCAQCHTHKYDPISHREYYELMAFLNNADEPDMDLPSPERELEHRRNLARADDLLAKLPEHWPLPEMDAANADSAGKSIDDRRLETIEQHFASWLAQQRSRWAEWTPLRPVQARANVPILTIENDSTVFVSGDTTKHDVYELRFQPTVKIIAAVRLEVLPDDRLPGHGPGLTHYEGDKGDFFLGEFQMSADGQPIAFERATHSFAANQYGDGKNPVSAQLAIDGDLQTGWSVHGRQGERHVAVFELKEPLTEARELALTMQFGRHFASSLGRFRVSVTESSRAEAIDLPVELEARLGKPELSDVDRVRLRQEFLLAAPELAKQSKEIRRLRARPTPVTTLVLRERPPDKPRPTHVYTRGEYLRPAETVSPSVPAAMQPLHGDQPRDRLGFARWLVAPHNPLTPRVAVNRQWSAFFGKGIVRTEDDFGSQGAQPSHPELLDWLAVEFVDGGWSIKKLHKLIVSSATYRQSSRVTQESYSRDPNNELLGRAPRRRLDAEMIRDSALHAAGLLSYKMHGPGTKPPQPAGVSEVAWGSPKWQASPGEDRYRRSIYTFVKRTAPFAAFQVFDAPSGETCTARRDVSNTPSQALTLLNDCMYTEAAQALGSKLAEFEGDDAARAAHAFRCLTSRMPSAVERKWLSEFVSEQRRHFAANESAARLLAGGDHANVLEQAVWTALARAILNLDEAMNRN
jgi:hypothetical protein